MRTVPKYILSGLTALALLLMQLWSGCTYDEPTNRPSLQTYPTSEATNATTEFLTGSVVTTRLHSGRFIQYAENDSAWAFVLHVDFYDSNGVHASALTADSALVREGQRLMEGFGNVHVLTDKGTTLESPHLAWNDFSQTVSTDSFVVVTRGEDVMSGYGFQSDPDLTRIVFRRQVSGRIADPEAIEEE
jgi:LPS export ABC transporter protein LptC